MSPPLNFALSSAILFSSRARESMTLDWSETQAPIWLSRGRDAKYLRDSRLLTFSTLPVILTWRSSGSQGKRMAAFGVAAISFAFALP